MSYESNREEYMSLIHGFLRSEIPVERFVVSYMGMWEQDRDEERAEQTEEQRQRMLEAMEEFRGGSISSDEFTERFYSAWPPIDHEYHGFLDRVFTASNQYTTVPELLAKGYYYTEEQLRDWLVDAVAEYEARQQ